jgi:protein-tyrosine-phosphatase
MPEPMKLLFVCTGNTCRSPMAEAIARKFAIERGLVDVDVASAGTSSWDGAAASDGALLVGLERRLDLSGHRSQQLSRALIESSDLIFTMGPHHLERVEALGGAGKSFLLTGYPTPGASGRAINDPMGGDLDIYRATADELEGEIRRVFDRLAAERVPGAS